MRRTTLTTIALVGLLILGCGGGGEDPKADKDKAEKDSTRVDPPKKVPPPPKELTDDWKANGAIDGWLRPERVTEELQFELKASNRPTDVVAFRWDENPTEEGKRAEGLRKVMPPEMPFGLVLDEANDDVLAELPRFKNLQVLLLPRGKKVTDKGFKSVCEIAGLQSLTLSEGDIDDAALLAIANLKQIKTLNLNGCSKLGDGACKNLLLARSIQNLGLASTQVTSAGLKDLAPLSQLVSLDLSNDTIPSLAELPNPGRLQVLILMGCKNLNDTTLAPVANLKQLTRLNISHTAVTDTGLKGLGGLKQLKILHTGGLDGVTPEGKAALRKEIPGLSLAE
jgi:hypothetical protein